MLTALPQLPGLGGIAVGVHQPTRRRDEKASKLTWLVLLQLPTALLQPGQGGKASDVLTDGEEVQEGSWRHAAMFLVSLLKGAAWHAASTVVAQPV